MICKIYNTYTANVQKYIMYIFLDLPFTATCNSVVKILFAARMNFHIVIVVVYQFYLGLIVGI